MGATYTTLPHSLLKAMDVRTIRKRKLRLTGGKIVERNLPAAKSSNVVPESWDVADEEDVCTCWGEIRGKGVPITARPAIARTVRPSPRAADFALTTQMDQGSLFSREDYSVSVCNRPGGKTIGSRIRWISERDLNLWVEMHI